MLASFSESKMMSKGHVPIQPLLEPPQRSTNRPIIRDSSVFYSTFSCTKKPQLGCAPRQDKNSIPNENSILFHNAYLLGTRLALSKEVCPVLQIEALRYVG
eukprot:c6073_g1_i1 orf=5-307(-)